jgi:hypothetical protein
VEEAAPRDAGPWPRATRVKAGERRAAALAGYSAHGGIASRGLCQAMLNRSVPVNIGDTLLNDRSPKWCRLSRDSIRDHGRCNPHELHTEDGTSEYAGDATPDGLQQHLLSRTKWDADAVRDDIRSFVVEQLHGDDAVLVVDETGDLKKGPATVGLQRQYTGTAGRIENRSRPYRIGPTRTSTRSSPWPWLPAGPCWAAAAAFAAIVAFITR